MHTHHSINYLEFPADNLKIIKDFYTQVFDWKFTDYGPTYTAFNDGVLDGGFTSGEVATAAGPLVILYSRDLERSLAAVTDAGGTIHKPIYEFPGGKRFHFFDPAGNELAIWSESNLA